MAEKTVSLLDAAKVAIDKVSADTRPLEETLSDLEIIQDHVKSLIEVVEDDISDKEENELDEEDEDEEDED